MNMILCPQCCGTGEYFDGKDMITCTKCDSNHEVPEEFEEEFYDERLLLDDPDFEVFDENKHSNPEDSL